ncbi:hypothetical protein GCM10029992_42390 [Glycomyces albus]
MSRRFDPEAVDEFISFLRDEIELVQNEIVEGYFKNGGALGRMPAFGIGAESDSLRERYATFHTGVWGDLQDLLASYHGFIDALEQVKEANAETEDATGAEIESQI